MSYEEQREIGNEPPLNIEAITKKMIRISKAIPSLDKSGVNASGERRYSFVREQDVLKAVKPIIIKAGVLMAVDILESKIVEDNGSGGWLTTIKGKVRFIDKDTGEVLEYLGMGSGWDMQEKGLYKAITGLIKYVLIKAFMIETGENDDPEHDGTAPKKSFVKHDQKKLETAAAAQAPIPKMTEAEMKARDEAREAQAEKVRLRQEAEGLVSKDATPEQKEAALAKSKENMQKKLDSLPPANTARDNFPREYPEWYDVICHVGQTISALDKPLCMLTRQQIKQLIEAEPKWNKGSEKDQFLKQELIAAADIWSAIYKEDPTECENRNELAAKLKKAKVDPNAVIECAVKLGWLPVNHQFELIREDHAKALLTEIDTVLEMVGGKK